MNINKSLIDNQFLSNAIGTESYAASVATPAARPTSSNPVAELVKLSKKFAPETIERIAQTLNTKYRPGWNNSEALSMNDRKRMFEMDSQKAISTYAAESLRDENTYKFVPNEVKARLKPLKVEFDRLNKKLAGMEASDVDYFATKWARDQHKQAMESILFNIISGVDQLYRKGIIDVNGQAQSIGTEDVGRYQVAVYYPVFETTTQWINCASTVYPKLVKVKDFANLITSIPIHFMQVMIQFRDDSGKLINEVPRESLYSKFVPSNPEAYKTFAKTLTIQAADFNKQIDLHADILTGMTAPFLNPLEYVRSDFYITNIATADGKNTGKIYDFRSGTALTETMHEIDRKGKVFEVKLDGAAEGEYYNLALYFDGIRHLIKVFYQKSVASMQDITSIEFKFKGNDVHLNYRSNVSTEIRDEQTFLDAGEEITYQIPVNSDEYAFIDGRKDGNYLTQQMNAISEYEANQKEFIFFEGVNEMIQNVRNEFAVEQTIDVEEYLKDGKGSVLYAYQDYDLRIRDTIRKEEGLNMALEPTFTALRTKLNIAANAPTNVQLNMLCSSYSLQVLNSAHKLVVGDVAETSNGKFLGVAQTSRTYVITVGSVAEGNAVNAVIVGSDKSDIKPEGRTALGGDLIPTHDIKYKYVGLPTFAESNIETCFFNQTSTRITNTGDVRNITSPMLPGIIMKTSGKFQVIRGAVAEVELRGYHIRLV